ncbi:hypothetical protein GGQ22_15210 [Nocardioides sp. zg-579]|uniref:DUF4175 domain-containing protein n=1 Tax=Nocardioides marmotae TaxID=2663857 RepID=A0A6I3JE70_9ACTN|nr:hypothetical protein [Nocardioides marmotae]MCR6032771.1 hypothetical protein [Gordonia jinghuaiqii]MTB96421.1 hypothetical protein [Nocardioides marmotae]QKE02052.1 hypothetical protein HPC71_13920 [Nocardioides marmotae]
MAYSRRRKVRPQQPDAISPRPFVGMVLIATAFFPYAASGLLAPWWAVVLLVLVWLAFLVVACAWWTPHPDRLPWLGVGALVLWFALMNAGGAFLGWTA